MDIPIARYSLTIMHVLFDVQRSIFTSLRVCLHRDIPASFPLLRHASIFQFSSVPRLHTQVQLHRQPFRSFSIHLHQRTYSTRCRSATDPTIIPSSRPLPLMSARNHASTSKNRSSVPAHSPPSCVMVSRMVLTPRSLLPTRSPARSSCASSRACRRRLSSMALCNLYHLSSSDI
jgi:hypothetical protein